MYITDPYCTERYGLALIPCSNFKGFNPVWYAGHRASRTRIGETVSLLTSRPYLPENIANSRIYRNPLVFAIELQDELIRDNLTRKQLAERHAITSDRVTQWLCLLKIPDEEKARVLALGDNWEKQIVTERELRALRQRNTK
jgi:hypothetical protein